MYQLNIHKFTKGTIKKSNFNFHELFILSKHDDRPDMTLVITEESSTAAVLEKAVRGTFSQRNIDDKRQQVGDLSPFYSVASAFANKCIYQHLSQLAFDHSSPFALSTVNTSIHESQKNGTFSWVKGLIASAGSSQRPLPESPRKQHDEISQAQLLKPQFIKCRWRYIKRLRYGGTLKCSE